MTLTRAHLIAVFAIAAGAGSPAFAQQQKSPQGDGQKIAASAGVAKSAFLANVTSEFIRIDTNRDGKVTSEELERHRMQEFANRRQNQNRVLFSRLDADKNGQLSAEEFAKLTGASPKINVQPLVTRMDANKDKTVSQAEFVTGAQADFERLDANKDNVLSPAEARAGNRPAQR